MSVIYHGLRRLLSGKLHLPAIILTADSEALVKSSTQNLVLVKRVMRFRSLSFLQQENVCYRAHLKVILGHLAFYVL